MLRGLRSSPERTEREKVIFWRPFPFSRGGEPFRGERWGISPGGVLRKRPFWKPDLRGSIFWRYRAMRGGRTSCAAAPGVVPQGISAPAFRGSFSSPRIWSWWRDPLRYDGVSSIASVLFCTPTMRQSSTNTKGCTVRRPLFSGRGAVPPGWIGFFSLPAPGFGKFERERWSFF